MFMRWRPIDEAHKEGITIWSDVSISNTFSLVASPLACQPYALQISKRKLQVNNHDSMVCGVCNPSLLDGGTSPAQYFI